MFPYTSHQILENFRRQLRGPQKRGFTPMYKELYKYMETEIIGWMLELHLDTQTILRWNKQTKDWGRRTTPKITEEPEEE